MKVIVYLPAAEQRALEAEGHDPAQWVRDAVKRALSEREDRHLESRSRTGGITGHSGRASRSESDLHFKPDPKAGKKK
jgi:hypothetical protein